MESWVRSSAAVGYLEGTVAERGQIASSSCRLSSASESVDLLSGALVLFSMFALYYGKSVHLEC